MPGIDYRDEATYAATRRPVSLASTLNPDAYRSAEFAAVEKESLWLTSWICVGYTQQLVKVGDTILARIHDQSFIITRSAPGKLHAFHNVCRHRGTEMLDKPGCHEFFHCPYHAWGYALDGKLLGAPYFKDEREITPEIRKIYETSGAQFFDKADYPLLPVRVDTWGCLVFINVDLNCKPLAEQLGDAPERLKNYPLNDLVLAHTAHYEINANWKLVAENFMEYYHLPTVHPGLNLSSHLRNHFDFQGPGWYYGMTTRPLDKNPDVPIERDLKRMPGLDDEEQHSARWLWMFPNMSVSMLPEYMIVMMIMPDGAGRTRERYDYFFHPDTVAQTHFKTGAEAVYAFWDQVNKEDIAIVEAVQRGLTNRGYTGGRMCFRFEENIHRFQNHVIDKVTKK